MRTAATAVVRLHQIEDIARGRNAEYSRVGGMRRFYYAIISALSVILAIAILTKLHYLLVYPA